MHSDAETALQKYADDAVAVEKDRAEKAEAKVLEDAKTYTNEEIVGLEFALSEDGKTLELKNKAGTAVATLDTTDFVVDGMLSSVVADQANNKLTFTYWEKERNPEFDDYFSVDGIDIANRICETIIAMFEEYDENLA